MRKLDRALGSTPAALLAGDSALETNFDLTDAGSRDGVDFVEAKPRTPDTGFERVRIGFADNLPRAMELKDTFGNVTTLTFGPFDRNSAQDAAQFRFVPPKGADVVGEEQVARLPRSRRDGARSVARSRRARADARGRPG